MTIKNVAVIGLGRIGKIHAANVLAFPGQLHLEAVADPLMDEAFVASLGVKKAYRDADPIFKDAAIDAVVICTPTDTHADMITRAARANKAVFCEKPVSYNPVLIGELMAKVKKAGVPCFIGFNRRFDPNFRTVKQRIVNGDIGTPRIVKIISRDPAAAPIEYLKRSGGMLRDMTIHDFDMVRYLGGDAVKVYAETANLVDPEIGQIGDIDTALITIALKSGAIANIDNCREASYGYDQRVEVLGSKGAVAAGNKLANDTVWLTESGVVSEKPLHFFLERYDAAYKAEMREFVSILTEGKQPSVGLEDLQKALFIAEAAYESIKTGRSVAIDTSIAAQQAL